LQRVAARYPNLIDLDQLRVVQFPEATLVSLPGYHDPNFINCAKGCRYFQSTLDEVAKAAKESTSPVVVVSHGPPLGEGSQAVDYASAAGNVGDPALRKALVDANVPFGIFTHIKEAGARATDLVGTTIVDPGHPSRALYLNPGPANTAKWKMNDGTLGYGFAAVLTVKGKEAWLKSIRLPAASGKETPPPTRPHPGPPRSPIH
jgi:Icc-related predicted phosphoesterase